MIARPVIAFFIAFVGVAIGGVLAVWPAEIRDATQYAFPPHFGDPKLSIDAFWLVVAGWGFLLYMRMKADDRKETDRLAELTAAIYRAPNYAIVTGYRETFSNLSSYLSHVPATESASDLADRIASSLVVIAGLARNFRGASEEVRYGANIMLVVQPKKELHDCFEADVLKALRFFDRENASLCALRAILYLPAELLFDGPADTEHGRIPLIALPVPHSARDAKGGSLALPGAPWALLLGKASIYEDASRMSESCGDLAGSIRREVAEYFSPIGDGKMIGSLVSFRIGDEHNPVGILNIDCSDKDLLGAVPDYYQTFYALMAPILQLLAGPVDRYAALTAR
jgi:hypothetical protein